MPRKGKLKMTYSELIVSWGWDSGGKYWVTVIGYGFSFGNDENVFKIGFGDVCTTLKNILKATELCTL